MDIDSPVTALRGVGSVQQKKFLKIGIQSVKDLITYYPKRYEDFSKTINLRALKPGQVSTRGTISHIAGRYSRRGIHVCEAIAQDTSGSVRLVWFNQPYRTTTIKTGQEYFITGQFGLKNSRLVITNPSIELVSEFPLHTARIVPVYRQTEGLTSSHIRRTIQAAKKLIDDLPEILPDWIISRFHLLPRNRAVWTIHFPTNQAQLETARYRLAFEELFELCLASLLNLREVQTDAAPRIPFVQTLAQRFVANLTFQLTDDQRRVVWQIYQDMDRTVPMNRLVEGDVGAGKTVVAAMAAAMVISEGFQVAFMAPTELLAQQHAETLEQLLQPLGYQQSVGLLIGSLSAPQKKLVHSKIADRSLQLVVGTHALLQEKVTLPKLGLAIIDEQHRFGVDQRKALQAKAGGLLPHLLTMTATPIPRSLALTVYGELDISILFTKPAKRKPVETLLATTASRAEVYKRVEHQISLGRQVFVVCPLVDEDELSSKRSAQQTYRELSSGLFARRRVGLLHGKMKAAQKTATMQQFLKHKLDILVATTVIEVGVDVPNATVMVIENADWFGLAQLHQLRGRVGRSEHQGYCFLITSDNAPPSRRLKAIAASTDGFRLSELDLEIRGPGAIYGTLQHGQLDLKVASLTDTQLIAKARSAAHEFIEGGHSLLQYKELSGRVARFKQITTLN